MNTFIRPLCCCRSEHHHRSGASSFSPCLLRSCSIPSFVPLRIKIQSRVSTTEFHIDVFRYSPAGASRDSREIMNKIKYLKTSITPIFQKAELCASFGLEIPARIFVSSCLRRLALKPCASLAFQVDLCFDSIPDSRSLTPPHQPHIPPVLCCIRYLLPLTRRLIPRVVCTTNKLIIHPSPH